MANIATFPHLLPWSPVTITQTNRENSIMPLLTQPRPPGCTFASASVASESMAEQFRPAPCGIQQGVSIHCTYPPSSPDSPPWQRSPDCSVISTPAQPYSFFIQIPLSCLFPPAPLFLPPFMFPFPLPAWISSLSLALSHPYTHTHTTPSSHSHSHTHIPNPPL